MFAFASIEQFQVISYARLVEKDVSIEERLEEERKKMQAVKDELPKRSFDDYKQVGASGAPLSHLDFNPHYFGYEPTCYKEAEKKYGLVFCDFEKVSTPLYV